jgi:serine/threonine protein kinase
VYICVGGWVCVYALMWTAQIFQVRQRATGRIYAMKCLRKGRTVTSKLVRHTHTEKAILINLRHPFLVTLHYGMRTPQARV